MATITLTIPDNQEQRVMDALCNTAGVAVSGPNAKAVIANYIKAVVRRYEAKLSEQTNNISVA